VATVFRTPFISGKDSLYNESPLGPVTPTLLVTAVGVVPDIGLTVSMDLKEPGNPVYIVSPTYNELGGSEYYRLQGFLGNSVPILHATKARKTYYNLTKAMGEGIVKSCHDLSEGGLAVGAAEMAFAGGLGLELDLKLVPGKDLTRNDFVLFSESNSRFLIEIAEGDKAEFERLMGKSCAQIGKVTAQQKLLIKGLNGEVAVDAPLEKLRKSWKKTLNPEEIAQ
jgi:phosphoribosylformylglycinamidine synthase